MNILLFLSLRLVEYDPNSAACESISRTLGEKTENLHHDHHYFKVLIKKTLCSDCPLFATRSNTCEMVQSFQVPLISLRGVWLFVWCHSLLHTRACEKGVWVWVWHKEKGEIKEIYCFKLPNQKYNFFCFVWYQLKFAFLKTIILVICIRRSQSIAGLVLFFTCLFSECFTGEKDRKS